VAISIQTQVTSLTITATVTLTPPTGGPITATTIGAAPPARVPTSGTPMTPVSGTTDQFTFDVPGPGDYIVTVTCGSESETDTVTVP
jgi:hypothetical protein